MFLREFFEKVNFDKKAADGMWRYVHLRHIYDTIRDRSLFKCQGGWLKGRGGGGHVNFHVASWGVTINFDFHAGGVMFKLLQINH